MRVVWPWRFSSISSFSITPELFLKSKIFLRATISTLFCPRKGHNISKNPKFLESRTTSNTYIEIATFWIPHIAKHELQAIFITTSSFISSLALQYQYYNSGSSSRTVITKSQKISFLAAKCVLSSITIADTICLDSTLEPGFIFISDTISWLLLDQ